MLSITSSSAQIKYASLFNSFSTELAYYQVNSADEIVAIAKNGTVLYSEKDVPGWKSRDVFVPQITTFSAYSKGMGNTIIVPTFDGMGHLYRSSDFGKTWEIILTGSVSYQAIYDTHFFTEQEFLVCGMNGYNKPWLKKTEDGGSTWIDLGTPAEASMLYKISFITEQIGFVKDSNNKYFKTSDGGISWTEFTTIPAGAHIIQFSSIDKGIARTERELFETSDGGLTWTSRLGNINIYSAQIIKGDTIITATDSKFYYTTDRFVTKTETVFSNHLQFPGDIKVINDSTFIGENDKSFIKSTDNGQTWTPIIETKNPYFFPRAFAWVNDSLGYFFASDSVYKSTSGGFNWETIGNCPFVDSNEKLLSFTDSEHGIAYTNKYLYRTSDGGKSWSQTVLIFESYASGLAMISASKGWVIGSKGMLEQTVDSGKTWTSMKNKLSVDINKADLLSINFLSEAKGIIGGNNGWVAITTDSGSTWNSKKLSNSGNIDLVHFFSDQVLIATHSSGIFRSEDGGANWELNSSVASENLMIYPVTTSFLNEKVGMIASLYTHVYTIDAGNTWITESAPTNQNSVGLHLNRDGKGVFFNKGLFIGFESDVLATSVDEKAPQIKTDYKLAQNYPNPFNPSTTISFTLKQFDSVSLSVYSIDGRLVSNLMSNKNLSSGAHEVLFDAKSLASGVYFYQLKTSQGVLTQKMTLIK